LRQPSVGGFDDSGVKYENGAIFKVLHFDSVAIHAIGLGTTLFEIRLGISQICSSL